MARVTHVLVLVSALGLVGHAALGAPPASAPDGMEKTAVDLFVKGRDDLKAGHPAEALPSLQQSMELLPSPNTVLLVGHAHRELGDRVSALRDYEATVALASAKIRDGETRFQAALDDAQQWAATLRAALSHVRVRVSGVDAGGTIHLGADVVDASYDASSRALTADVWHEPAELTVVVEAPHAPRTERSVHATAGSDSLVEVNLTKHGIRPPPLQAWVAFGVGGAGMISFAVAGGLALSEANTLDACSPHCDPTNPELTNARDAGKRDAIVANVSVGIGSAAIVTGAILWILDATSKPKTTSSGSITFPVVGVGPGSLSLSGTF